VKKDLKRRPFDLCIDIGEISRDYGEGRRGTIERPCTVGGSLTFLVRRDNRRENLRGKEVSFTPVRAGWTKGKKIAMRVERRRRIKRDF